MGVTDSEGVNRNREKRYGRPIRSPLDTVEIERRSNSVDLRLEAGNMKMHIDICRKRRSSENGGQSKTVPGSTWTRAQRHGRMAE